MNGIDVLYRVRQQPGIAVSKLLERFAAEERASVQGVTLSLQGILRQLEVLGIIVLEPGRSEGDSIVSLTPQWDRIYGALGMSLSRTWMANQPGTMAVRPMFGIPDVKACDVFVVMPFEPAMDQFYRQNITRVVDSLGLRCLRADDMFSPGVLMNDTWSHIATSSVILADCTGRNPNVFYEIGLAHAIGQKVVLITQHPDDMPFDLRHLRYLTYTPDVDGLERFETSLRTALEMSIAVLSQPPSSTLRRKNDGDKR